MRSIIVDDEANCIGTLQILLEKFVPEVELIGTFKNGTDALALIEKQDLDLVFLDIAMPKMNGFEMLAKVSKPTFEVVFTTAYDEYALKAMKVSAVDYLLKPIDRHELLIAVEKVKQRISLKSDAQKSIELEHRWKLFLENINQSKAPFPNIALPTSDGMQMVAATDILYIRAEGNYSQVRIKHDRKILVSKNLGEFQEMLHPYEFVRVHHSHLVNAAEIAKYIKGEGGYVILRNGDHLDVSRRRKPDLLRVLKRY